MFICDVVVRQKIIISFIDKRKHSHHLTKHCVNEEKGEAKPPHNGASRMMLITLFKNTFQNNPRQGEAEPPHNGASRVRGR